LTELSVAFERKAAGAPFIVPESCNEFIEINRLLLSMHLKNNAPASHVTHPLTQGQATQRPVPIQHPVSQSLVNNAPDIPRQVPMPRQAETPLPQTPLRARLGIRTVSGSRQLPSSGPLQMGTLKDDE